jgi:hypothetical protein
MHSDRIARSGSSSGGSRSTPLTLTVWFWVASFILMLAVSALLSLLGLGPIGPRDAGAL